MEHSVIATALAELYPALHALTVQMEDGKFWVAPITVAEYSQGVAALKKIEEALGDWPEQPLPSPAEEETLRTLIYDCFESEDRDWKDNPDKEVEKYLKDEARAAVMLAIINCREHLDLRLCADAANKIAFAIGRPGVRLCFQGGFLINDDNDIRIRGGFLTAVEYFAQKLKPTKEF